MMLGTSPSVGAADAFLARGSPVVRGASPAVSPPTAPGSASSGMLRVGFGGMPPLSSSPSECGNGASMSGAHRRRSVERVSGFVPSSSPTPTVTGFNLDASASALDAPSAAARMPALTAAVKVAEPINVPSTPNSPGGLSRGVSALRGELERVASDVALGSSSSPASVGRVAALAARPPAHGRVSLDGAAARPLEALSPAEAKLLSAAQERHDAFAAPSAISAFRVAAAAARHRAGGDEGLATLRHCVETAATVAELGARADVVAAALMHKALEGGAFDREGLRERVPDATAEMVEGATKLSDIAALSRASDRAMSEDERLRLRAMLLAATDARVVIIELANRLDDVRRASVTSLGSSDVASADAARSLAEETMATYVPLASRLGVWGLKSKLEDACFAVAHPERHAELGAALDDQTQRSAVASAVETAAETLASAPDLTSDAVVDVYGRPKSLYGVFRKMRKKGVADVEGVHDARAIRVIVREEADCYAALRAVHAAPGWTPVDGKTKDYVKCAKRNGYRSLHTVVKDRDGRTFEVQIRTEEMHRAAEFGLAAHWRYKEAKASAGEDRNTSASVDDQVAWARFMLSWQGQLADDKLRAERFTARSADAEAEPLCAPCPCPFPTHDPDCHNHEDNLAFGCGGAGGRETRHDAWDSPLVSADSASMSKSAGAAMGSSRRAGAKATAYVVVVVDGGVRVLELAEGARLSDVDLARLRDEASPEGDSSVYARASEFRSVASVSVNGERVPPGAEVAVTLRMGDVVVATTTRVEGSSPEGSPGTSAGTALGSAAYAAVEEHRRRLSEGLDIDVHGLGGVTNSAVPRFGRADAEAGGGFRP